MRFFPNFIALFAITMCVLSCCGTPFSGNAKVYYLDPTKGLVRKQVNEVIPFSKAKGFLCASKAHFEQIVTCTGGSVKVYYLDPAKGLVRKQANEVKSFESAKGYYCGSSATYKEILDKCASPTGY